MYRLALRITLNSQEAEDVVQDVIIKLWQKRDSLADVENLEAYALRMVRNLALDRQRMKINQSETLDLIDDNHTDTLTSTQPSAHDMIEREERMESIREIMKLLPEKQRVAMQLRDFEGQSYKEIANIMNITEDQVKVNIFRARQAIKNRLTSFNN